MPGKDVHIADALSRASAGSREQGTEFDTVNHVTVSDLTTAEVTELQKAINEDEQMNLLRKVIHEGWPHHKVNCDLRVAPFWDYRDELSLCQGMIVKGLAVVHLSGICVYHATPIAI